MGNQAYRTYQRPRRLSVWRVVLGWDLVPRLPDFFWHAGHTVQLNVDNDAAESDDEDNSNPNNETAVSTAIAYYQHYGNETLGYAGVPSGWASRAFIWVPGALESHHIRRYLDALQNWPTSWVTDFARVLIPQGSGSDDDSDDTYVDPPFDDFPG